MISRARERARRRRRRYLVVTLILLGACVALAVTLLAPSTGRGPSKAGVTVVSPEQKQVVLVRRALQQENEAIRLHLRALQHQP